MNHIIKITGLVLSAFLLWSCNNDFLDKDMSIMVLEDTVQMTDVDLETIIPVIIPQAGSNPWKILQYPGWLTIDKKSGVLDNGSTTIRLRRNSQVQNYNYGYSYNPLILEVEGIGYVEVPFIYGCFGRPSIACENKTIDFSNLDQYTFTVSQIGSGYFAWYILSKPDWLGVSSESGIVPASNMLELVLKPVKINMELGNYQGKVIIANNSTNGYIEFDVNMTLTQLTLAGQITPIEGEIIASEYHRTTDMLYILTKVPNKIIFMKGSSGETRSVALPAVPTCANYSPDGNNVITGFASNKLCNISVGQNSIVDNIVTDCPATGIVYGDNNWIYVATNETQSVRSINLNTKQVFPSKFRLSGNPIIKKAPHKGAIYGTTPGYSPSQLYVCDCSNGMLKDTIDNYWIGAGNMWFSEDGNLIFTKELTKAYYTPAWQGGRYTENLPIKGKYSITGDVTAVEYNSGSNLFWVGADIFYANSQIFEFNSTSFAPRRTFNVNSITAQDGQIFKATVNWIFSNKEGTNLFLLKRNENDYGPRNWQLEKLNLPPQKNY